VLRDSSISRSSITLDRYGHLMPGNKAEAAALLDAYLDRSAHSNQKGRRSRRVCCSAVRLARRSILSIS